MSYWKEALGEYIGIFILVFIGCSSVAVSILYFPLQLWQIALIWALGVATAIYSTQSFSHSHLNPAVTIAFALNNECKWNRVPTYIVAQLLGAATAGAILFALVNKDLMLFELQNNIIRGDANSSQSAVMFGEFIALNVQHLTACLAEGLGTFSLVLVIFILGFKNKRYSYLNPVFIGLTVGIIILVVAPYTQAGLNPARDFGPRIVAYLGGWGNAAYPSYGGSFFSVYILSPILGGALAYLLFSKLLGIQQ